MATIKIENHTDDSWQTTIEQRAYLTLSTLSASLSTISISFVELPAYGAMPRRYRCCASSPDLAAGNCKVSVEHPDGDKAIDGTLLRFRRIVAHTRQIGPFNGLKQGTSRRTS